MAKSDLTTMQVNLTRDALQKLHVISQVYRRHVGDLIRDAVDEHIKKLSDTEGFRTTARSLLEQQAQTIEVLLGSHEPEPPMGSRSGGRKNVTPFPGNTKKRRK